MTQEIYSQNNFIFSEMAQTGAESKLIKYFNHFTGSQTPWNPDSVNLDPVVVRVKIGRITQHGQEKVTLTDSTGAVDHIHCILTTTTTPKHQLQLFKLASLQGEKKQSRL